jgi:single-stranded-DNA-specific exonuclease
MTQRSSGKAIIQDGLMSSATNRTWRERPLPQHTSYEECRKLADRMNLPLAIILILARRGVADEQAIRNFLSPSLQSLPSPCTMQGMKKAVELIVNLGLNQQQPIIIYGDYDADGITSTSLLFLFLSSIGARVSYYIPDRLEEGYGLNSNTLRKLLVSRNGDQDRKILITVDCGISNSTEVHEAKNYGCTVIITDHHHPPPEIPDADAVLNPLQPGCSFPAKNLAGVGVAFYLLMGIRKFLYEQGVSKQELPNLKSYLDLVAIGTIADLVSLEGVNRIFVKAGLEVINERKRLGISALCAQAMNKGGAIDVTPEDCAFRLIPRINAAGRMGRATKAVELIISGDACRAKVLAEELDQINKNRKAIQEQLFAEAIILAQTEVDRQKKSIILYKKNWHQGVVGIVASQICDRFARPTILLTDGADAIKGSCRANGKIHIFNVLSSCNDLLEKFGGHENAGGVTLRPENLSAFKEQFENEVSNKTGSVAIQDILEYDDAIPFSQLFSNIFLQYYSMLAPFGNGNPEPIFTMHDAFLKSTRIVGTNHLKFTIQDDEDNRDGIGFGLGFIVSSLDDAPVALAFHVRNNQFFGREKWELNLLDVNIKSSSALQPHPQK